MVQSTLNAKSSDRGRLEDEGRNSIARARKPVVRDLTVPRRHVIWKTITVFETVYVHKKTGTRVTVHTLTRPPTTRVFRAPGGRRKFKQVHQSTHKKEFIFMAKSAKTKKKGKDKKGTAPEVTDKELEELENLEDPDAESDDDAEPDDEDDEDETPATSKKGKKNKGKKGKSDTDTAPKKKKRSAGAEPGKSRAAANGKVGTAEVAAAAGTDARSLRMLLRKRAVEKDPETNRYEWSSLKDKTVKKIIGWVKAGEVDVIKKDSLEALKKRKEETKATDASAKKGKKGKKGKKAKE